MDPTRGARDGTRLRLLVDSNFVITLEPYAGRMEPGQPLAAEVARLAADQGHRLCVHPATRDDLLQGRDPERRAQRIAELAKYPLLEEGPIPAALVAVLGEPPATGSNDHRDLRILAALHQNAAPFLITDDRALRRRATRVGLADRVLTAADAAAMLRQLAPALLSPPPRVRVVASYALDGDQPIFESLRADYDGFDSWLDQVVRPDADNRDCLVIDEDGRYAALAIVKRVERDCPHDFPAPVSKIATFKVDVGYVGSKYGELLLKSIFRAAHDRGAACLYVEVLPKHAGLVELLGMFGFVDSGHRTVRGELVLAKRLRPTDTACCPPLQYHIAFGPPAIQGSGNVFVVPILPGWHEQLFPDSPTLPSDAAQQLALITKPDLGTHPWGNALRKAYLCHSPTTRLQAGDTILFYRSRDAQAVTAVGVVEDTLRSGDAAEVLAFVAGRTVYTPDEVAEMCARVDGVLAVLFRQDRFIDPPWTLPELQANAVLKTWPQSITSVRERGRAWVNERLAE